MEVWALEGCLLINVIILELARKYLVIESLEKQTDSWGCSRIFSVACSRTTIFSSELNHFPVSEKTFQINNLRFCEQCGVEFVDSRIRRYQMGNIKLACPVMHVWYLKRLPSYIVNLLDKSLKELEDLVYCNPNFFYYPELRYISKSRDVYRAMNGKIEKLEEEKIFCLGTWNWLSVLLEKI
ncbi:RNA polymerase Rpb1, domain 1 [Cynara cardunculus var. scolymus]|uniref:RNA polymerase Rpb1, domain 1 n=1 Tax=Cynara cardunculus var. scolymus TaxID=59895 RepID=A0A118K2P1_CYNCS|nr:RNA polymerase Rpb1, domain 1 [Cynara cardunculus var. scolymus]